MEIEELEKIKKFHTLSGIISHSLKMAYLQGSIDTCIDTLEIVHPEKAIEKEFKKCMTKVIKLIEEL